MNRLTERDLIGAFVLTGVDSETGFGPVRGAVIDKLADYEDADEQGRLARLPCKVGGTLWSFIDSPRRTVYSVTVSEIRLRDKGDGFFTEMSALVTGIGWGTMEHIRPDDVGKTMFLTRAEAEAALQERSAAQ